MPNGIYDVRLVAADPAITNGNEGTRYSILAEGVRVITNDVPIPTWWIRGFTTHIQVRVADRRLTISNGPIATNNSIAFIEIKQVAPIYWGSAAVIDNTDTNKSPADYVNESSPGVLGYFEGHAGKKVGILGWGLNWGSGSGYAPFRWQTNYMTKMWARGTIPYFSWMPQGPAGDTNFSLQNIIAGKHDSYLSNFAAEAKAYGKPFFLRFAWEMNGVWSSYGEGIGYNAGCPPGSFTNMWRHVHDIFTKVGCTNATWIWCMDRDITNQWHFGPISGFYPGPDYVDWVGFDSYNRTGESLESIFSASYNTLSSLAPGKPIMTETASYAKGGPPPIDSKPAWISDALAQVPVLFPNIKAFMWWNWHDWSTDSRNDVTIEGGDNWLPYWEAPVDWVSVNAFSNGIASPYYVPNLFTNLKSSPIQPIDLLSPPAAISASISNSAVKLVWFGVAGATNYNLYRSTTGSKGSFNWLARTSATNWTDATTAYGTKYYYTIAAENVAGESLDSAQVSVAMPRPALRAHISPTNTLLVSWPVSFTGFALESSADLMSNNWQGVFAPPSTPGLLS